MLNFLQLFFNYIMGLYNAFNVKLPGLQVGYCDLAVGFIIIGLVISVFWKGARA